METLRLICYAAGIVGSLVLAGQLFRIRHSLARLMAMVMVAWALNSATLLALLYIIVVHAEFGLWREILTTANALLLAGAPAALYAWFLRENGRARNG